jgi:L-asparagine oxygenase
MSNFLRLVARRLDDPTRDLLGKELTEYVAASELDSDADQTILAGVGARAIRRYLPGEILRDLEVFSASAHHGLVISNLPGQHFPDTPVHGFGAENELAVVNAVHLGLIQLLGTVPYAVDYENDGRLIRNVVPNPDAAGSLSSWGADSDFSWHTDNPHLPFGRPGLNPRPYIPRYLTFYAVRNEEKTPTEVIAFDDVSVLLDDDTLRVLSSDQFRVAAPASNDVRLAGDRSRRDHVAVIEHVDGQTWSRYDPSTTEGLTERARAGLVTWSKALDQVKAKEFVLESGDFLIFDNYRVLHRRRAFRPQPAATARWLRRCYTS